MELIPILILAGLTLGFCWLVDLGFQKAFRSAPQHRSGLSVRLNKHFGGIGIGVLVLGLCGILAGIGNGWLLIAGGSLLLVAGGVLVVYYTSFGIYYDCEGFVLCTFGKRSATYRFADIRAQQLFITYGKTVIELYLTDGRVVQLQGSMTGVEQFMDKAYAGWLEQRGLKSEDCPFHDPANSCWFPPVEE